MKVLAVAYKPVSSQSRLQMEDEAELILLGYVVFFDAPKSSAASALQKLEQLHVQVKVLTGDQKSVTLSICRRLGIETEHILTGEEMEDNRFFPAFPRTEISDHPYAAREWSCSRLFG